MIAIDRPARPLWWSDTALLLYLALIKVLIHFCTNGNYGYFRDELYYIACSDHLAWGYVDHPPASIFLLAITRKLLGDSIFAIRLPVVLAGAACVVLTGLMARQLGGGRFAQWLAGLSLLVMPTALAFASFFSMNAFDLLFWIACAFILIRMIRSNNPRLWLAFGLTAGLGLMNKISVGFLGFGVAIGLLLTPQRRLLFSPWACWGGALAFLLFLPYVVWQFSHGFATLVFMHNATLYKNLAMSPASYLRAQLLLTNPLTLPVWLAGLGYLLFAKTGRRYRALGLAYLAVLFLLIVLHGKAYYLAPAYPMLFAAGGIGIERFTQRRPLRWLRPVAAMLLVSSGAVMGMIALPILPPDTYGRYAHLIGIEVLKEERNRVGELPQILADRLGWENMVATIARVYDALPPQDRARCAILTSNYGEAAAVDFFGPRYRLPKAISGHNNYWLWGPGNATGDVVIVVGIAKTDLKDLQDSFEQVEQAATIVSPYASPSETSLPVYVCRHLKVPLKEAWPRIKHFI
jgi:Dolichyl-phosphate-mannose-protein mannosyltransferase